MILCIPDPAAARALFAEQGHMQGAIFCGLMRHDNALLWRPDGWWRGLPGTLRAAGQAEQRAWLKASREAYPWDTLLMHTSASRRTWEAWEGSRAMPDYAVLALALELERLSAARHGQAPEVKQRYHLASLVAGVTPGNKHPADETI